MRNKTLYLVVFALLAFAISACSTAQAAPPRQDGESPDQPRTLNVNGTGVLDVVPDMARISIGVQTESEDAAEAVAENNAQAQAVIDALGKFEIAPEDIQTTNFSVYPRQVRVREGEVVSTTFVVQNTVRVTVRDLDLLGEILDASVEQGANNISGIQFDVEDRSVLNEQALEAAVEDARSRAEILAEAAGVELGVVLSIDSFSSSPVVPVQRAQVEFAAGADVPISAGQIQVMVDVNVRYEIQ